MKSLALALVAALAVGPAYAQMFKCRDDRGITHYTDKPGPECRGEKVDIRPPPYLSGKAEARKEDPGKAKSERQPAAAPPRQTQQSPRRQEGRRTPCEALRDEYEQLSGVKDAAEREKRAAQLKIRMADACAA